MTHRSDGLNTTTVSGAVQRNNFYGYSSYILKLKYLYKD